MSTIRLKLSEIKLSLIGHAIYSDMQPGGRQHTSAVRLLPLGKAPKEVAKSIVDQPATVYNWRVR